MDEKKTALEIDIEHYEKYRTSPGIVTILIMLALCLCLLGLYTLNLRTELKRIQQASVIMKENFSREKVALITQIKQLQAGTGSGARKKNM